MLSVWRRLLLSRFCSFWWSIWHFADPTRFELVIDGSSWCRSLLVSFSSLSCDKLLRVRVNWWWVMNAARLFGVFCHLSRSTRVKAFPLTITSTLSELWGLIGLTVGFRQGLIKSRLNNSRNWISDAKSLKINARKHHRWCSPATTMRNQFAAVHVIEIKKCLIGANFSLSHWLKLIPFRAPAVDVIKIEDFSIHSFYFEDELKERGRRQWAATNGIAELKPRGMTSKNNFLFINWILQIMNDGGPSWSGTILFICITNL